MNDESKALNAAVLTIAFIVVTRLAEEKETSWGRIAVGGTIYLLCLSLLNGYNSTITYRFSLLVLLTTLLSQAPSTYKTIVDAMGDPTK